MTALEQTEDDGDLAAADGREGFRAGLQSPMRVRQDKAASWMAMMFGAMALILIAALWIGHFTRTESVRGYVSSASGVTRIAAQANGIVDQLFVKQGDRVDAGQRLMTLKIQETTSKGLSTVGVGTDSLIKQRGNLVADVARLAVYLDRAQADEDQIRANNRMVRASIEKQERDISRALALEEATVKRLRALVAQGYATRDPLDAHQRTAFDYARQLSEARVRRAEADQQTTERLRTQQLTVAEKRTQRSTMENQIASIDSQLVQMRSQAQQDILAPASGTLAVLPVDAGTSVQQGQIVAVVGDPTGQRIIVLEAPARAIGLAKNGQTVVLKYDAFPFKTFGIAYGSITSISTSPISTPSVDPNSMADPRTTANAQRQSTFRVEVKPDKTFVSAYGVDKPIALGSTLTADIVVERRRLIDWILDPIRAMQGRG